MDWKYRYFLKRKTSHEIIYLVISQGKDSLTLTEYFACA